LSALELLSFSLATQHLSRLVTKDSVTAVLRAPFVEFNGPAGEGRANETPVGAGVRKAIGELLTCPFCTAQWVATGLVACWIVVPSLASAAVSTSAVARTSDYLQVAYGLLRRDK
jgi:hypothetical protein